MIEINQSNFQQFLQKNSLILVDFSANWCGPCKIQHPILNELQAKYGNDVHFAKIDIDENHSLAMQYGITSVPTIMFFLKGKKVRFPLKNRQGRTDRFIGVQQQAKLAGILEHLIKKSKSNS